MPSMLIKGVRFESESTFVEEKAQCSLQVDLHNLGPGKVTELELVVRIVEKGSRNRLLAEQHYPLSDMQEGELRTENLSFESLICENSILQVELVGTEVETQYYQVALNYSHMRW